MSGPGPGWYDDPGGSGRKRYWDGTRWTEQLADGPSPTATVQPPTEPVQRVSQPAAQPAGPPPGWYPDPAGGPGTRYWDGSAWTDQRRQPAAAPGPAAAAPPVIDAPPPQGAPYPDQPRKRRTGLLVGTGALAVLLIGGLVAFQVLFARGAATPLAAVEEMVAAIDTGDTLTALRLLPPDEVDWLRALTDDLPEFDGQEQFDLTSASLSVEFGQPRELTDGVQAVPLERFTLDLRDIGPVPFPLGDDSGSGAGASSLFIDEDLRGEDVFVLTVQRGGSWFVSPLGTGLELTARSMGVPGAGPASERSGASDAMAAVDTIAQAFVSSRPAITLLDVLDPSELQVLDHYRPLLNEVPAANFQQARFTAVDEGGDVRLQRLDLVDDGFEVVFDFERLCVSEPGWDQCLRDELFTTGNGTGTPWVDRAARALFEPDTPVVRVGTVQADGRSFISLADTVDATLSGYLERIDEHAIAGVVAPVASPHAVESTGSTGETLTLPLVDGWNVIRFPEASNQLLVACPAQSGLDWSDWTTQGRSVVFERIGDPFLAGWPAQGLVIGVEDGADVTELDLRVVDLDRESC